MKEIIQEMRTISGDPVSKSRPRPGLRARARARASYKYVVCEVSSVVCVISFGLNYCVAIVIFYSDVAVYHSLLIFSFTLHPFLPRFLHFSSSFFLRPTVHTFPHSFLHSISFLFFCSPSLLIRVRFVHNSWCGGVQARARHLPFLYAKMLNPFFFSNSMCAFFSCLAY